MSVASGLEHLKPFLPGLEDVLEDPEVSEIMINGPHNVWIEGGGKLYSHEAPPFISPGPWAWIRPTRPSSMRAWTTARGL